jgi:hypothetical protein
LVGSAPKHPYPDLSPSRGKEVEAGCSDMSPFYLSAGERKIMEHFVVRMSFVNCHIRDD